MTCHPRYFLTTCSTLSGWSRHSVMCPLTISDSTPHLQYPQRVVSSLSNINDLPSEILSHHLQYPQRVVSSLSNVPLDHLRLDAPLAVPSAGGLVTQQHK